MKRYSLLKRKSKEPDNLLEFQFLNERLSCMRRHSVNLWVWNLNGDRQKHFRKPLQQKGRTLLSRGKDMFEN